MTSQVMTTESLRNERKRSNEDVEAGFGTYRGFQAMTHMATSLANSTIIPEAFRNIIMVKDRYDSQAKKWLYRPEENPNGVSNCIIALNMAQRLGADPMMIMQNLYLVDGRPSWSSQFIIAAINSSGRYSPLRFDITGGDEEVEIPYATTEWVYNQTTKKKEPVESNQVARVKNYKCVAWVIEKETGERLESTPITMEMAVKESWYQKNGSKWQTMPEQMLRYRAASFFGRIYAPDLLMGLRTQEEELDAIIDITPEPEPVVTKTLEDIKPNVVKSGVPKTEQAQGIKLDEVQTQPEPQAEADQQLEQPIEKKPTAAELRRKYAKAINNAKDLRELAAIESQIACSDALTAAAREYLEDAIHEAEAKLKPVEEEPAVNFNETELEVTRFKEQIEAAQTQDALTKIRATFSANGTLSDDQHEELCTALNQKMATLAKPKAIDIAKSQAIAHNLTKMISDAVTVEVLDKTIVPSINAYAGQMTADHANKVKSAYAERKAFLENQISMFNNYYEIAEQKIQSATTEQEVFDVTMSPDFSELSHEERSTLNSIANQKLNEIKQG